MPPIAPYGSWKSPITSDLIVADSISITGVAIDGEDVYWIEMRPSDGARNVVVRRTPDGRTEDVTPSPFNVRTRVQEYGGGSLVVSDGVLYFSNFDDQRMYRQVVGGAPRPITPEIDMRYADGVIDRSRNMMICVREDHSSQWQEAVNTLVAIDLGAGGTRVLVSGNNFYSTPRISPDGRRLAWLTWRHPNMPWDGTELWVGDLQADGSLGQTQLVAGGKDESIFQPEWSPGGVLYFVSDRSGWWNFFRLGDKGVESVYEMEAEFALPQWAFGMSTYGFASESRIICAYNKQGTWHIADLDTESGSLQTVPTPYTDIGRIGLKVTSGFVVFTAGSPTMPMTLMFHNLANGDTFPLKQTHDVEVGQEYLSAPEAIEFPTENGLTSHAFYYPPKNGDFEAVSGEKPPLLVISHGGPTGATTSTLSLMTQYWTSRGIAVVDVNYGGSTGYGTEYRRRLNGMWGVTDVDDCVNAAKYLVERGLADENRLMIRGSSAGGYTTLMALTTRDTFKAGASYYGLSELEALLHDTHKFESRYLFTVVGPYPERKDLYYERSAINHLDGLSAPMIMFQGLDDKIVPPSQSELMLNALREKGLPVAYVAFEGEQHGFRKAENIKRALDGEFYFYSQVFGFEPADELEPVEIENLSYLS